MIKKFWCLVLMICTLNTLAPCISAESIATGENPDKNITWTFDNVGVLTISGEGEIDFYDLNFNFDKNNIKKLIINEGITGIELFLECENLTSVVLPQTLTNIGSYAFCNCKKLTDVIIPNAVTNIDDSAFAYCNLTNIQLPHLLTNIGNSAFIQCGGLTSIEFPESLINIGEHAFLNNALTDVYIPKKVNKIGAGAFAGNTGCIITVSEANENYSSVDGALFNKDKSRLISYTADRRDASGKRSIYEIPEGVEIISSSAFLNIHNLRGVKMPDSLITIEQRAFDSANLTDELVIPKNVENIAPDAISFSQESSYRVDERNTHFCSVDGVLFNKEQTKLIAYPSMKIGKEYKIPDKVETICSYSFTNTEYLTSIIFSDSVTSIDTSAFEFCTNLKSVITGSGLKSISNEAFYMCWQLTDITIGKSVENIGFNIFTYCDKLSDVYYCGTKWQWKKISIDDYNEKLFGANIHYFETSKPLKVKTEKEINTERDQVVFNVTALDEDRTEELMAISLFVAEYDENGVLNNLVMGQKSEISNNTISVTAPIANSDNYKYMLWDDISSPLMEEITNINN